MPRIPDRPLPATRSQCRWLPTSNLQPPHTILPHQPFPLFLTTILCRLVGDGKQVLSYQGPVHSTAVRRDAP
jgi:hypothetical protein